MRIEAKLIAALTPFEAVEEKLWYPVCFAASLVTGLKKKNLYQLINNILLMLYGSVIDQEHFAIRLAFPLIHLHGNTP